MLEVIIGDDLKELFQLKKNNTTFNIPVATVVKAALLSRDQTKLLAGPFTLSNSTVGADWSLSLIAVEVLKDQLTSLTPALAKIQIQVDAESWFFDAQIIQGQIN